MQRAHLPLLTICSTVALLALVFSTASPAEAGPATPEHAVAVSGTGTNTYPDFDPSIGRYGILTDDSTNGAVSVTASTTDPDGEVRVNGRPADDSDVVFTGLEAGDEVAVQIVDSGGTANYGFIYLPSGFPRLEATTVEPGIADGLVFLGLISLSGGPNFETVVDNRGVPIHVGLLGGNDFKRQPDGRYSLARPTTTEGRTGSQIVTFDAAFQEVASYETVGLVDTDFHESLLLADDSRILIAYEPDARPDLVIDSVIQHVAADGTLLFEWNSKDHIPPEDGLVQPVDYAHINSVDILNGGDLLASFRNTSQVLRIARTAHDGFQPGDVVWRLGGTSNDFTFVDDPLGGPCAQHTARELDNGHILLFDNGAQYVPDMPFSAQTTDMCPDPEDPDGPRIARPHTRVAEYALDENAMTATLVWSYEQGSYTTFAGSSQRMANGNTLVGWAAAAPMATEVDSSRTKVWELAASGSYITYRALRFPAPDAIDPTIGVVHPEDEAVFAIDEVVDADFECSDRGGATLTSCRGAVAPGEAIDTSVPGVHEFEVAATDGAGNTTTVTHSYVVEPGPHQPDGVIRKNRGAWVGDRRYGTDGVGQGVVVVARPGRTVFALVRAQNDGTAPDAIAFRGSRNIRHFQVRYFRGATDVTAAVKAGTYRSPELAAGAYHPIRVEVTATPAAGAGEEHRVRILLTSAAEPIRRDAVVATTRIAT